MVFSSFAQFQNIMGPENYVAKVAAYGFMNLTLWSAGFRAFVENRLALRLDGAYCSPSGPRRA